MRVTFLLTQDRGGPADLTVGLANELARCPDGPEITVVGPLPASCAGEPWSLLRPVHVRSKLDARGFASVARALDELGPDIIHAQDRRAGLVSAVVGRNRPLVLTFHGVPDNAAGRWVTAGPLHGQRAGLSGGSRLVADALVARRVHCTVAPSAAMADFLRRELRVPGDRVRVVPNGVTVPARPKSASDIRIFATAGTFAPAKATPLLIQAFNEVTAIHPHLTLRMLGDGADRRRCEVLAAGANGQVEFTGYRCDVADQFMRVDAFVLPSLNENQPLALLQAMAAGLPCIASDVGGVRETLGGTGILVAPGSVSQLSAAMRRLADEPRLAAELGAAARARAEEQFSLARCASRHLRVWNQVLGETSLGAGILAASVPAGS